MITRQDSDAIRKIISSAYKIKQTDENSYPSSYRVEGFSLTPEDTFQKVVDDLLAIGFIAFTDENVPDTIYVISSSNSEDREMIRFALFMLTIGSVIYAGYSYSRQYFSAMSSVLLFGYSSLLFFLPISMIFFSREVSRYIIMRRHNLEYSLPIFIPDPIFMGCLGSISVNRNVFRNRKTMIEVGFYPLLVGFLASIITVVIGTYIAMTPNLATNLNIPITSWGYPIILLPGITSIASGVGVINPLEFAGWAGIIMSGFNALPLGYLDGGLVWNGLIGRKIHSAHYPVLLLTIIVGLFNPEFIILPVIILLLGLRGPEPLTLTPPPKLQKAMIAGLCLVILFGGMVPFHYAPPSDQFSASVLSPVSVIQANNSTQHVSYDVVIHNTGSSKIQPSFTVSPSAYGLQVGSVSELAPGSWSQYNLMFDPSTKTVGITNYTVTVSSGVASAKIGVSVIAINYSISYLFNSGKLRTNPIFLTPSYGTVTNLTLFGDFRHTKNMKLYVVPEYVANYSLTLSNLSINTSSSPEGTTYLSFNSFEFTGGSTISMSITMGTAGYTGYVSIYVIDQKYNGAAAFINY